MDIKIEKDNIDKILKSHMPKKVEKDFFDKLLLKEEIGRFMGESPDKDIHVTVKVPMDKLLEIKAAIEKTNQGKIYDIPLLATEIVSNLIWRYFNTESIEADDFIDLTVRNDVDETVLSTSGTPTDETDLTPIKEGHKKEDVIDAIKSLLNDNTDNEKLKAILSILMPNAKGEIEIDETVLSTSNTTNTIDQPRTMKETGKHSLINASYYENGKYVEDIPLDITELENAEIMDTDEQLALNPREEDIGSIFYRAGKNIYAIKGEK